MATIVTLSKFVCSQSALTTFVVKRRFRKECHFNHAAKYSHVICTAVCKRIQIQIGSMPSKRCIGQPAAYCVGGGNLKLKRK